MFKISETTRARKLKYLHWVQKLYYMTQHEDSRRIDFWQMSISEAHTANNCKKAFSLHVVESASDDHNS